MLNKDEKIKVILKPNKYITIVHNRKKYDVDFFFDTFKKGFKTKDSFVLINVQKIISIPLDFIYEVYSDGKKVYPLLSTNWEEIEELEELKQVLELEIQDLIDLKNDFNKENK